MLKAVFPSDMNSKTTTVTNDRFGKDGKMASRKAVVTQTELKRYLAAYRDAGIPVGRTEIGPDGTVVIHAASEASPSAINDWDAD